MYLFFIMYCCNSKEGACPIRINPRKSAAKTVLYAFNRTNFIQGGASSVAE